MSDRSSNDNDQRNPPSPVLPDAHGRGALLLVESLIHVLIEKSIITLADGIEIVGTAVEVSREIGEDSSEAPGSDLPATTLLLKIGKSLAADATPG